jgi:L-alanine-DL-glutamate epimerase-like enolase superfamily enzyme
MKIVSVTARVLRARRARGVVYAAGSYPEFSAVLVQVDTDDGITGYGKAIARALRDIFVGGCPEPHQGVIDVPSGPGLGLELDLDLVERYTVG